MLYSYNLLQSYIKQKLPSASQINDAFHRCLGDISFSKVKNDYIFDVELTPNRVGALSGHKHMALEICAMFGLDAKEDGAYKLKKVKTPKIMSVKNDAKKSCECYFGIVLDNVNVKESPEFIKDALQNCGMRSINNVVDITNYVMLELGQPMHAFDYEKIAGKKIVVRNAKKGEKITVLTGDKYMLDENIMVIADGEKPMAIAGIKGGMDAEIDEKTKTIVLESANFKNTVIYKTSKNLNLITDASIRFSHTISSDVTRKALARAVELLEKYADAKVASNELLTSDVSEKMNTVPFNLERVEKLIGQKIDSKEIENILLKLGYKVKKISSKLWNVSVPLYRLNVLIFEDIVDDVARIYGLDNLESVPPRVDLFAVKPNGFYDFKDMVKDLAVTMGLNEVYNYSFINDNDLKLLPEDMQDKVFGPKNYMSLNYKYMSPASFVSLIKNVATNLSYFDRERIFQIDNTYLNNNDVIEEKTCFSFALYDANKKRKELDLLLEGKGVIETMLERLAVSKSQYYFANEAGKSNSFDKVFRSIIFLCNQGGDAIGYLGILNDKTKNDYKIKNDQKNPLVVIANFDLEKLYKLVDFAFDFRPIPKYPSSIKDISVLVDKKELVQDVMVSMLNLNINDLKDIDLFDVYEMEEGFKKSLSFHLIFRNDERTLEFDEIENYLNSIKQHLIKQGYIIR